MLQGPYYLAIGSVVVEAGSGAGPYHVFEMQLPAPRDDGRGDFEPAVRIIRVRVTGANPGAVSDSVAALRRQCVRDNLITLQSATGRAMMTTRIRKAHVAEAEFDPLDRSVPDGPKMYLTLTLTTDPHWLGAWGAWTPTLVTDPVGHFDIPAAGGEDDALVDMRIYYAYATNGIFIGGRPDPAAGFQYGDIYLTSMETSNTWKRFPGAPAINALANRGRYIPILVASIAGDVASSTGIRSAISTLGYAITAATPDVTGSNRTRDTQGALVELPRVTLPSAAIPESINGDSFATKHHIEVVDDNMYYLHLKALYRIPVDYAAVAYRGPLAAGKGIVYHGDTDTVHIADADGIGGSIMADADIIRPLRAAPGAVTRMVFGHTAQSSASNTHVSYRVRPRYLSATG